MKNSQGEPIFCNIIDGSIALVTKQNSDATNGYSIKII